MRYHGSSQLVLHPLRITSTRLASHHHHLHPQRPRARRSDPSYSVSEPIPAAARPPRISTHSAPALRPIVPSPRTNYAIDRSCPSSHIARESDHGDATYEHDDTAVPRVPVTPCLTAHAAVYAIPVCRERSPDVVFEPRTSLAAVRSVSEEIRGVLGELSAVGEHSATCNYPDFVPSLPARPSSPVRREHTSKIASSSPTPSYSARINPIEDHGDIGVGLTPSTQPVDRASYEHGPLFPAVSATSAPRECPSSIASVSLTSPEPALVVSCRNDDEDSHPIASPVATNTPRPEPSPPLTARIPVPLRAPPSSPAIGARRHS